MAQACPALLAAELEKCFIEYCSSMELSTYNPVSNIQQMALMERMAK